MGLHANVPVVLKDGKLYKGEISIQKLDASSEVSRKIQKDRGG